MKNLLVAILLILLYSNLAASEKVKLQLKWKHQFQFAGYYMAKELGFYEAEGLDVTIVERDLHQNNIYQVLNGEAQYGIADAVLMLYMARGENIVIVAPIFQHSPNVLLSLKEKNILSPYDLNDKKMLFYPKDSDGFGILAMFHTLGVSPKILRPKNDKDMLALLNQDIDVTSGYISNEPFYYKERGVELNIIYPGNYGLDLYGDTLFTSLKEAQEHPERVEKFKRATIKGWEYALTHKEESAKLIHKKYATNKSYKHLVYEAEAIEELIWNRLLPIGTLDKGRFTYAMDLMQKLGLIEKNIAVDSYIFDSLKQNEDQAPFTQDQLAYLQAKKELKLCVDPDWMPFEKIENSQHVGMSADVFKMFANELPIPVRLYETKSWTESLQALKERKCDLTPLVMPTEERKKFLLFTKPYLNVPVVITTRIEELFISDVNDLAGKKVAFVKGYAYAEIYKQRYSHLQIESVENIEEGLQKVASGELYGLIDTLATAGYFIQRDYVGRLKIAGKFDDKWELGVGVRSDEPLLKDIFDRLVQKISEEDRQGIFNKWVSVVYERSFNKGEILKYVGLVVLFFTLVMGIFIFVNRRLKQEIEAKSIIQKRLEVISITDELTQLYNRRYYNDTIQKAINSAKREKGYIAFVIFDLDFFKQYNDTYGHQSGDAALVKIAAKLKESLLRADDYAFRLGGEEFGIFFRAHNPQDAFRFVDQIRLSFEALQIEHAKSTVSNYLTASFGMVCKEASKVIDAEALYRESDNMLYKAKANGRNRVEMSLY